MAPEPIGTILHFGRLHLLLGSYTPLCNWLGTFTGNWVSGGTLLTGEGLADGRK